MNAKIRWISGLLLLGVLTAAVAAWQLRARDAMVHWDPITARKADAPIPVRTITVEPKEVAESIGGTAVTMPAETAMITIPISSSEVMDRQVATVNVHDGSAVKKGDTLLTFEPVLFQQTVDQRKALVSKSEQELAAYVELAKSKAATAMQVSEAKAALETARLELALAQRDLDLCVITSPIDGVVDELSLVAGTRVGGASTLAVVHKLGPIFVQMDFPMERIDALKIGQEAEIVLDAFAQEKFKGEVVRIDAIVSTKTRVLPIMLQVENVDNRIKAGISGFARLKAVKSDAVAVPSVAVIKKQEGAMVVCLDGDQAHIRPIRTGAITDSGEAEVPGGLNTGDVVVIYGQDSIEENDVVNANWREWTRRDVATR